MHNVPDAVILCGGVGSRLRTVTEGPKAMALIGGRPFLELLLKQLRRYGVERVILAVGYQRDAIESHFGDSAYGLQLVYSPEETPLGTGGALRQAAESIRSDTALVLNGDSYTGADLQQFLKEHAHSAADISVLIVRPDLRDDFGTVLIGNDGRLLAFHEKQQVSGQKYLNTGIYAVSRDALHEIPRGVQISLEREIIPDWLVRGKRLMTFLQPATCIDIGTPERYRDAQVTLAEVEQEFSSALGNLSQ